jgi:hypothetical protein
MKTTKPLYLLKQEIEANNRKAARRASANPSTMISRLIVVGVMAIFGVLGLGYGLKGGTLVVKDISHNLAKMTKGNDDLTASEGNGIERIVVVGAMDAKTKSEIRQLRSAGYNVVARSAGYTGNAYSVRGRHSGTFESYLELVTFLKSINKAESIGE